jgi:DNA mismatch endonuclease (patch repair protein)
VAETPEQRPPRRRLGPRDPAVTSRMMARVRNKDSKAELALRRALHAAGVRYRLHAPDVTGRPDLVIRSRRLAVFVDGDLWHGNPEEIRRRGRDSLADLFPTRTDWWVAKIERTVARDREVTDALEGSGWTVIRLWEHDVLRDPTGSAETVRQAVRKPLPKPLPKPQPKPPTHTVR